MRPLDPDAPRDLVVVDVETSGLALDDHIVVEVGWWNLNTGEYGHFVPPHDVEWVRAHGDPAALAINGYWERITRLPQDDGRCMARLAHNVHGCQLAGKNVGYFDHRFLERMWPPEWAERGLTPKPAHRSLEVGSYVAGVLGLPLDRLPSLDDCAQKLGIADRSPHEAMADVDLAGRCLLAAMDRAGVPLRYRAPALTS